MAAKDYENHCSVLINNIAQRASRFKQVPMNKIGELTNAKIENHSFVTDLLMIQLRSESLRKYRGLVVNVGVTKDNLVNKNRVFENAQEQSDWEVYRSTMQYWNNLATVDQRQKAMEVDFVKDSEESQDLFEKNLKYLGLEVTPGSHVDQVIRSVVSIYTDR